MPSKDKKRILFYSMNSPGHINSSLGIADKLRHEFDYETIFLVVGETIGNTIVEHGHKLIMIEEHKSFEDYEISSDEDMMKPFDEEAAIKKGKKKVKFYGFKKWPQFLMRYAHIFRLPKLESRLIGINTFEKNLIEDLIEFNDKCIEVLNEIKPDLIFVDAYFVPPSIVSYKSCPWVRLFSANPIGLYVCKLPGNFQICGMIENHIYTKKERERLRREEPNKWEALVAGWKNSYDTIAQELTKVSQRYNEFLKTTDCELLPHGKQTHDSPYINFYLYPKELDYDQDDDILECPSRWFRCDSLMRDTKILGDKDAKRLKEWEDKFDKAMKGKKKSIYFSLGSIASGDYRLMKKYVEVFKKDQDRLYVISKGVNGGKFKLDDRNMIGDNFLPQTLFLQKVDMAIIHGGNNSVTECFYYGIPVIVLPAFGDQIDNAIRVEDLDLGRWLDAFKVDETPLFEAIDYILGNKELIDRCKAIGEKMRLRNDAAKGALLMKKLIEEGKLDQAFIDDCRNKNSCDIKW